MQYQKDYGVLQNQPSQYRSPLASEWEINAYDKAKRKNNGLIIVLVIITLLTVASISAILILLFTPNITIPGPGVDPDKLTNLLNVRMNIVNIDETYDINKHGDSDKTAFKLQVANVCAKLKDISLLPDVNFPIKDNCAASSMSAHASGLNMVMTIKPSIGIRSVDFAFITLIDKIKSDIGDPYRVQDETVSKVPANN